MTEVATTEVKTAHMAANAHIRDAMKYGQGDSFGLVSALLAIERRIYWHGLVMQQRP